MVLARGSHKFDRVTITFVPTADEASFHHVPSTFSPTNRTYGWRHSQQIDYMIVPRKISSNEIKVDMFVDPTKRLKSGVDLQKAVQSLVKAKIQSEWQGLKLAGISRATVAAPPEQKFARGTIEEILGATLEK
jgi:hypothetical protein